MTAYTSVTNVSNELAGYTIDSSSVPSSSVVEGWIRESDEEINLNTGMLWSSTTASSEVHDYDGSGVLFTKYNPVLAVSELLVESNGLGASTSSYQSLTEGRTNANDYIIYKPEGEINFHGSRKPQAGFQNLIVSYTYGFENVPEYITRLSTLMTAKRLIESVQSGSATNEGGTVSVGTISVSDPGSFGTTHLKLINSEIKEILSKIGSFKTYRLDRRY